MSHIDSLMSKYRQVGKITGVERTQNRFERVYIREDIALLTEGANAYNHQNGKTLKQVCSDMYHIFDDDRFEKLQKISTSHLYNLKKTPTYQNATLTYTKTKPVSVHVRKRKKPYPKRRPGFLRVDSIHQGDLG